MFDYEITLDLQAKTLTLRLLDGTRDETWTLDEAQANNLGWALVDESIKLEGEGS